MIDKLPKEALIDLIENVVKPIVKKFNLDPKEEYQLVKLAILLILNKQEQFVKFKKFINFDFSEDVVKEFIKKHSEWVERQTESFNESDDFFDFDSEEVDENINNMHYEDHQKISAKEFMSQFDDEDFVLEIQDEIEELKHVKDFDLDEHYLAHFKLDLLINLFNMSIEFKDLGYALSSLQDKVQNLDLNSLDETQKQLLKAMLDSIIDDLAKWVDMVLVNQEAQDIHYLDASLLANIAQIDIMLNNQNNADDLELF